MTPDADPIRPPRLELPVYPAGKKPLLFVRGLLSRRTFVPIPFSDTLENERVQALLRVDRIRYKIRPH